MIIIIFIFFDNYMFFVKKNLVFDHLFNEILYTTNLSRKLQKNFSTTFSNRQMFVLNNRFCNIVTKTLISLAINTNLI